MAKSTPQLPISVTDPSFNSLALVFVTAMLLAGTTLGINTLTLAVSSIAIYALLLLGHEGINNRPKDYPSSGRKTLAFGRILGKWLALASTYFLIYGIYAWLPLYEETLFQPFLGLFNAALPWLLIAAIPYIALVDARMSDPRDGLWEAGQVIQGRWLCRNWSKLRDYARAWAIKAFFLPLMFGYLFVVIQSVADSPRIDLQGDPVAFFLFTIKLFLIADLLVATAGYIFTLRLFGTHIRSTNHLVYGWVFTLLCYYPIWPVVYDHYLTYGDGMVWHDWFPTDSIVFWVWGMLILGVKLFWVYANAAFGLRFSNLTHRGIITNGAFRFTKHPSYIAKNIGWWLISVPFLSTIGPAAALGNCVLLLLVNAIYFIRARAEEQHLSSDPAYVEYANWMNEHGIFSGFTQQVEWLRYRAPLRDKSALPRQKVNPGQTPPRAKQAQTHLLPPD
jgi:hypothetical protein